jgi:hypothetical protein
MTADEGARMVKALGSLMRVLADADPADKAESYGQVGLTLVQHSAERHDSRKIPIRAPARSPAGRCLHPREEKPRRVDNAIG